MHAFPQGVMCESERVEFAIKCTNQTKSIVDPLIDSCTAVDLRSSDRQADTCDRVSPNRPDIKNAPSGTRSLANASNEPVCFTSFKMSHTPVHSALVLDSAAKSSMKRNTKSAESNRTSRFELRDELPAVRRTLPPNHPPATCSHRSFSSYLLNSSSSCNSHPAVPVRSSPTRSPYLTKSSHITKSPHPQPAKLSPPAATKPNSPINGKQVKASSCASYASTCASSIGTTRILILFCLILQLIANGVQAASTAFDYQNNQADNSIVYQGTKHSLIVSNHSTNQSNGKFPGS